MPAQLIVVDQECWLEGGECVQPGQASNRIVVAGRSSVNALRTGSRVRMGVLVGLDC